MTETIGVLLAEPHNYLREQFLYLLNSYDNLAVVATAATGPEAIELCARLQPSVIVLDAELPIIDGFTAIETIRHQSPNTKIILMISTFIGKDTSARETAHALIMKPFTSERLVQMIRAVHETDLHPP